MPIKRPSLSFEESRQRSRDASSDAAKVRQIYAGPNQASADGKTSGPPPAKGEKPKPNPKPVKAAAQGRPKLRKQASRAAAPPSPIQPTASAPIVVGIDIPHPEPGYSATYDEMVSIYGADRALRAVFKQAFDDYMQAVKTVSPAKLENTYPHGKAVVRTSRKIDSEIFERLRAHYDKFALLSAREIGKRIATAAVGAYLDRQIQESRS